MANDEWSIQSFGRSVPASNTGDLFQSNVPSNSLSDTILVALTSCLMLSSPLSMCLCRCASVYVVERAPEDISARNPAVSSWGRAGRAVSGVSRWYCVATNSTLSRTSSRPHCSPVVVFFSLLIPPESGALGLCSSRARGSRSRSLCAS